MSMTKNFIHSIQGAEINKSHGFKKMWRQFSFFFDSRGDCVYLILCWNSKKKSQNLLLSLDKAKLSDQNKMKFEASFVSNRTIKFLNGKLRREHCWRDVLNLKEKRDESQLSYWNTWWKFWNNLQFDLEEICIIFQLLCTCMIIS